MKVSVAVPQGIGADLPVVAADVEALGFDGIFVFDHLVPVADPSRPATEAAGALGAIAAATRVITVGSLVLRSTLRPPPVTAAIAGTLAAVASGRVVIGLGAGDKTTASEMHRFGLDLPPLGERIEELDRSIEAVAAVGVDVWVGGTHPRVRALAAKADAWNLWETDPVEISGLVEASEVPVTWGGRVAPLGDRGDLLLDGPDRIVAGLARLESLGIAHAVLTPVPAGGGAAPLAALAALVR